MKRYGVIIFKRLCRIFNLSRGNPCFPAGLRVFPLVFSEGNNMRLLILVLMMFSIGAVWSANQTLTALFANRHALIEALTSN
jgi:hypothetical protein